MAALRADLEQFLRGGGWFDTLRLAAGQTIVSEGEPGSTAYIIQSGNCEVYKTIQGERRLLRSLGPGDVFGEAAVFAGGPRTATIVAADEVTLKIVTGEARIASSIRIRPWPRSCVHWPISSRKPTPPFQHTAAS
ncbi:MAG TPA: cyclic nucleotide-binding domain-containing protein [Polyangiaceae bacterium]|nr:cyclic nucleotide-binding domain-containing protein [Polyangiaceae bacterium]